MKRVILPVLVIVLAVTSAFTTADALKIKQALVEGYIAHNAEGTDCELIEECSTINTGAFCRVGQVPSGQRLYIMNDDDHCLRIGYKP
ncbi:DUF6520 family protein [Flavobacterium tructae]|uniref:DUF6520 family protein n=1 Tax=Flavobacterium TaxID=237 RepID=UPI00222409E6|nr:MULTISPECIES: DUF6520 family protein [Flavobacterium]MDL2145073.1 DUF6520 family protein [Flavobacterium tructae]